MSNPRRTTTTSRPQRTRPPPPSQRSSRRTKRRSPTNTVSTTPTSSSSRDTFDDDFDNNNRSKRKCCCCCSMPVCIVVTILFVIAGGIVLWQFLPSSTKDSLKDRLPNLRGQGGGGDGSTSGVGDAEAGGNGGGGGFNFGGGGGNPPESKFPFYSLCNDRANCCNGVVGICDMPVNEVMFASLHNGGSTVQDGFYIAGNHEYSLEDALEAGYRGISLDIGLCGKNNDELKIIHGGCTWGSRDPYTVFRNIHTFLQNNPREVVLLPMEIVKEEDKKDNTDVVEGIVGIEEGITTTAEEPTAAEIMANYRGPSLDAIYDIMQQSGLTNDMYWHDRTQDWPTLMQLIEMDKRLIFFYYNAPDCNTQQCPPGFQEWFRYAIENPWSFDDVEAIRDDPTNSCSLGRGKQSYMQYYALNLFVTNPLPSKRASQTINTRDFLEQMILSCETVSGGLKPNVLFVDFWSTGDVVEVVQSENQRRSENFAAAAAAVEQDDTNNGDDYVDDGGRRKHNRDRQLLLRRIWNPPSNTMEKNWWSNQPTN